MDKKILVVAVVLALGAGAAGGWWWGKKGGETDRSSSAQQTERKVLYWYDPMKPDQHFDKPGKSPFMDMDLIPRYADEMSDANAGVRIDPVLTQNTAVKLAPVEEGQLDNSIDVTGSVVFNDRDVAIVQARTGGIVERVYPYAVGDVIAAGAPLADVRVPDWLAAQNEYLALRDDKQLADAARSRLLQLGMSQSQIVQVEKTGRALAVVTISSPRSGMIAEQSVREGMMLSPGQTLMRVNGLSSMWVEAEVPEAQAAQVRVGSPIKATFAAWPNQPLSGKVAALVPELNKETRTIRVRVDIPNKNGLLRPGMTARVDLQNMQAQSAMLLIPSDAVIATGLRKVVIVALEGGRFLPAEVETGREQGGRAQIVSGLEKGEQVVVSGQFMIDSEASLRGTLARMQNATDKSKDKDHSAHAAQVYEGTATVKAVTERDVTLIHDPIPALKWPSMTMPFELAEPGLAKDIKPGDRVRFSFIQRDDEPIVQSISKVEGESAGKAP